MAIESTRRGGIGNLRIRCAFTPSFARAPARGNPSSASTSRRCGAQVRADLEQQMESLVLFRREILSMLLNFVVLIWDLGDQNDHVTEHSWGFWLECQSSLYEQIKRLKRFVTGNNKNTVYAGSFAFPHFPQHRTPEVLDILQSGPNPYQGLRA